MPCLACTLPSLYLVSVVFGTAIPTSLYIFGKCFSYLYMCPSLYLYRHTYIHVCAYIHKCTCVYNHAYTCYALYHLPLILIDALLRFDFLFLSGLSLCGCYFSNWRALHSDLNVSPMLLHKLQYPLPSVSGDHHSEHWGSLACRETPLVHLQVGTSTIRMPAYDIAPITKGGL